MARTQGNDSRRRLRRQAQNSLPQKQEVPSRYNSLVLMLDSYWQPHDWVTVEEAITYEAKELVQQHVGQDIFILHGGVSAKTGEQTQIKTSTIIAIKGASKQTVRKAPMLSNRVLFRRDRHVCAYCGDVHTEGSLTRDHVIPVSKGGKDTWTNCVTACYPCNNRKGDRLLKDTGQELLYVPYTPCHFESMLLRNRRILADQMEFLMNGIKNKDSRVFLKNLEH